MIIAALDEQDLALAENDGLYAQQRAEMGQVVAVLVVDFIRRRLTVRRGSVYRRGSF